MWATMTEIQLLCHSEHTYETNILGYHINNKSSVHGLTIVEGFLFLTRERQAIIERDTSCGGSSTHWCIQTLLVLLHALVLLSHGRLHMESEPMSYCSE